MATRLKREGGCRASRYWPLPPYLLATKPHVRTPQVARRQSDGYLVKEAQSPLKTPYFTGYPDRMPSKGIYGLSHSLSAPPCFRFHFRRYGLPGSTASAGACKPRSQK